MMRAVALALALMLAPPASAAGLGDVRAEASGAAARLEKARTDRAGLEKALAEVAARIETLKSERGSRGSLFADGELDAQLKRSQSLSGRLNEALRAERDAEQALRASQGRLVQQLERSIDELYGRWEKAAAPAERQGLVPQLRALRAERDSLRRSLPEAQVPRFAGASEDSEELLERADALLDSADKLHREEQALTARIQELQRERALQRRMDEFLSESALFDEHDRRIVVSRANPAAAGQPSRDTVGGTPQTATPGTQPGTSETKSDWTGGGNGTDGFGTPQGTGNTMRPAGTESTTSVAPKSTVGVLRAPPERRAAVGAAGEYESLEELTAKRARIHALADDLQHRAAEAARRARELEAR